MIDGIGHVAIKVRDVERALGFWRDTMGFAEMLRLHHDDGSLFLIYLRITDTQYVEIFPDADGDQAPGPNANGVHHVCLTVPDIEAALEPLIGRGAVPHAWGQRDRVDGLWPTEAPQIVDGLDGNRQCWLADPDGNRIELMEMAPDSLQAQAIARLRAATSSP